MNFKYIPCFLLVFFSSCSSDSKIVIPSGSNKIDFESNTFNLHLDNFTPFGPGISINGFTNDQNIIIANSINHSIDFYNLNTGKFKKRIKLTREGPFGIPQLAGAKLIGEDSILVFNRFVLNRSKLYSVSSAKHIRSKESFFGNWSLFNDRGINTICTYFSLPVIANGYMYLMAWPLEEINFSKKNTENNHEPIEFKFNLQSKELTPLSIDYPPVFHKKRYPSYLSLPTRVHNSDQGLLVYCWPLSNQLGIYNIKNESFHFEEVQGATVKARYEGPSQEDWPSILNSIHYKALMYDPVAQLYYRFFNSPVNSSLAYDSQNPSSVFQMPLSIQIIDSSFKEMGVIHLGEEKYDYGRSFIYNNRIYLSMNNIFNKNIDENIIKYEVIRLYPN